MILEVKVTVPELVPIADNYKDSLLPLIEEIKTNLQSMNIVDLENDSDLRVRSDLSKKLSYELGKLYRWIHGDRYDPLLHFYSERLNEKALHNYSANPFFFYNLFYWHHVIRQ